MSAVVQSGHRLLLKALLAAIIWASLPTLIGLSATPPDKTFIGNVPFAPADFSVYYGYINQGRAGHLFMYDVFTSEPHVPTLIQPVWFVLGMLGRITGLAAPTLFVIGRFLAAWLFVYVLWWAVRWLWPNDAKRQTIGLFGSLFAGGLGGLIEILVNPHLSGTIFQFPDLWVTEMYSWLSLWGSPHFLLVTSGIIFVLIGVERSWVERRWRWTGWAGIVALGVAFIHPFHVITWFVFWMGMTVYRTIIARRIPWEFIARWCVVLVLLSPALLLYGLQLLTDPATIERATQNINVSPEWWRMLIGLGVPFLVAVLSWRWARLRDNRKAFVTILALTYIVAIYIPLPFQRRLSQGMIIPLAWLATEGAILFWAWGRTLWKRAVVIAVALLTISTPLIMVGIVARTYIVDARYSYGTYYLTSDERRAAQWLAERNLHQPVMSTLFEGLMLGGLSAHQMFFGYSAETFHYQEKKQIAHDFYTTHTKEQQRDVLQRYDICYVIEGDRTKLYGSAFQPQNWTDLVPVFSSPTLTIYQTPYCR